MTTSERGRFLLLEHPIPSNEIPHLLGTISLDPNNPLDIRTPRSRGAIDELVKQCALEPIVEKDLSVLLESIHSWSLRAALKQAFTLAASRGWQSELSMKTARLRTIRLKDHNVVFKWITKNCAEEIKEFLEENSSYMRLYMIVGFMTAIDEQVMLHHAPRSHIEASGTIPVMETAQGLTGLPPTGHTVGNPSIEMDAEKGYSVLFQAARDAEQVVAVQYRKVKRSFLSRLLSTVDIEMRGLAQFGGGRTLGSGDRTDSSEEDEDEDEDDDENEELMDDALCEFPTVGPYCFPEEHRRHIVVQEDNEGREFIYRVIPDT